MPQKWNIPRNCKLCGALFYARKHDVKCGRGIYCSRECSIGSHRTGVQRACKKCGNIFTAQLGVIKKGFGKFCSKECFLSSYRLEPKKCLDCGISIDYRAKRCSKCYQKLFISPTLGKGHTQRVREILSEFRKNKKSPKTSGRDHWNWKGGITDEALRIRKSIEYRLWREAVYARDNWTCQVCQQKGGKLEAHHISPFADYPELRFAIDNGKTLCKKCHDKTKKGRGNGNNKS